MILSVTTRPTLRERQRQAARALVAEAALPHFLARGYAGTTTKAIAEAAGVSEGTIFNYFGAKSAVLLEALRQLVPSPDEVERTRLAMDALPDGEAVITQFCRHDEAVAERALPLARVFVEAAASDAEVASWWRDQEEFRHRAQRWLIELLDSHGWLRTDLPKEVLARRLWITASPEVRLKWEDADLPTADFRAWEEAVLQGLLLPPGA